MRFWVSMSNLGLGFAIGEEEKTMREERVLREEREMGKKNEQNRAGVFLYKR